MSGLRTKSLDEITWQDIEALAASGTAEDAMLEFKGLLPEKNGKRHAWYDGRDDITSYTRDKLAEEVVAFANAYGGRLIIGIAETQDRPRKAAGTEPLPRCGKFAEQFEQALRSLVDPPIGGLQIRAIIDPGTEDAGAVIIAVPASELSPHGIGRPPAAYVRRGTACEPMTMRDLQSVFWDGRTSRERVEQIRAKYSADLPKMARLQAKGELRDRRGQTVDPNAKGLLVRVTAIPQQSLEMTDLPAREWGLNLRPNQNGLGLRSASAFGEGAFRDGLTRTSHGLWAMDVGPSRWDFRDDGTVSVVGFKAGRPGDNGTANLHYPGWYAAMISQVMVMADRIRRHAGRPDVPIEIDIELLHDGSARGGTEEALQWGDGIGVFLAENHVGPLLLANRAGFENAYRRIEREVWYAFGSDEMDQLTIDFQRAWHG